MVSVGKWAVVSKDLTASIIQFWLWKSKVESAQNTSIHYTIKDFINNSSIAENLSGWEIRRFADKVKDIVCILLNCTREQLEDREFKEAELGEEWWYYKGEVGIYPYNTPYEANKKLPLIKYTPRKLLQNIGTDLFRNQLHPNIWVSSTFANYLNDAWIITDVRFPNELQAIKDRNGIVIRVNRNNSLFKSVIHESETSLDNCAFDYVIENNSDIPTLVEKVKEILIKENII